MPKTSANAERGMDGVEKAAILLIAREISTDF
mgnify:CR=1 FL=1